LGDKEAEMCVRGSREGEVRSHGEEIQQKQPQHRGGGGNYNKSIPLTGHQVASIVEDLDASELFSAKEDCPL